MTKHLFAAVVLAGASVAAAAGPIYRCGKTYSQTPCPNGTLVDAADPRTAAQRAQAKREVAREKRLAAQMESDRRAREAASAASQAGTAGPAASAAAPARAPARKRTHRRAASSLGVVVLTPSPNQPKP
ncbi:MAG TPA: hypothetical protein VJ743_18845 [Albitalea sp.]|nr:hypothetical protein [Albitalea sp.]